MPPPFHLTLVLVACLMMDAIACGQTARVSHGGTRWTLANACVERVVETQPYLHTVAINNLTATPVGRHAVESHGFALALDDRSVMLTSADFQVKSAHVDVDGHGVRLVVPLRCEKHRMDVKVTYRLGHGSFYLHKQIEIASGEHLVNWVDVESLRLGEENLRRFDQEPIPFLMEPWDIRVGRPLFAGDEIFLGVEHPASINSFDQQRWISLREHIGRKGNVTTSQAVIGVCPNQPRRRLLDCFEQYIDENRARPIKRSVQWVAYFRAQMDDHACRQKIAVAENVFGRRQTPLDVVLMDSGWTDPRSIMKISPERPDRLELMSKLVRQRLGAKLGLHVITSGVSPWVDKDYLAAQGYDMIRHKNAKEGAYCLADPRVFEEFQGNLLDYVRRYDIAAYKFDWGDFTCGAAGHRGHLPGKEYGFAAGAANFVRVQQALRQANPEIFLFNTGWYSPWWLRTYDAIFAAGGDYNFALEGPPSFATSPLLCTWRDATIRGNLVRWSPFFPINSLMTVDPISYWWQEWNVRAESPLRPFTDYFLTACLRGTQMIEIYNNISAWSDAHADAAAAILKWMKAQDEILLASTRYLGGDPLAGQPYGYAHFTRRNRGILVLRNPSLESRRIRLSLDESAGMWPTSESFVIRVAYPYTKVLPGTVRYGQQCSQQLCGHETMVWEVWPLDMLPEPMPVGRRYQVVARELGKTIFRLEDGADTVEVVSPVKVSGGMPADGKPGRYLVRLADVLHPSTSTTVPDRPSGPESAPSKDGLCYVVPVRRTGDAQMRVAFQFTQQNVRGEMTLDGVPTIGEAPHLRLPDSQDRKRGTRAMASRWSLFGVDIPSGRHEVRFRPAETPKEGALVLIDVRRNTSRARTFEISHEPLTVKECPLLPQNWSWEVRQQDEFRLTP